MQAPSFLVALAILSSALTIGCVLFLSYDVFCEINQIFSHLQGELRQFKDATNEAWDEIMTIQWKLETTGNTKRRSIVERDVFVDKKGHRVKTRQNVFLQRRLPAWCQCEPVRPICPPGPRGPPGERGPPGLPGTRGQPGMDNYDTIRVVQNCDLKHTGCVRCPSGPPGVRGAMGDIGRPGPMGEPGISGERVPMGPPGLTGSRGDQGPPGAPGLTGEEGLSGKPGVVMVYKRGPPGLAGDGGLRGPPGRPGALGAPGVPGPMGPPGSQGFMGPRGEPGHPGMGGRQGPIGRDAGYCPCPRRSMLVASKKIRI